MLKIKDFAARFFTWKILIFLAVFPVMLFLPIRSGFTQLSSNFFNNLFQMWANFDGAAYLTLAAEGQGASGNTALMSSFFPVYPWMISTLNSFIHNSLISGLLISNLAFFVALIFLYKIFLLDYKEKIARFALLLILIFPTSFFFGSVYPESLFLLLTVLTFYFARKNNFIFASIFAAIASATQITGIFLWPVLIIEFYLQNGSKIKNMINPHMIWLALPPLGLISFMRYLQIHTGNAFAFFPATDKLILLHQIFYRYINMIIFMEHFDPLFFTILLELLVGLGFLVLLIFSIKKIRSSYWIFCLLSYFLPSISGTFSELPRYVIILFPLFGFLAVFLEKNHPYFRYFYYFLSIVFAFLAISFFTRGYFVA